MSNHIFCINTGEDEDIRSENHRHNVDRLYGISGRLRRTNSVGIND